MSVIPGYDFDPTEQVTANKLLRWLSGSYVDPSNKESLAAQGITFYSFGTGTSQVSLASEGAMFYNESTGKIEVNTRWGLVPVMGGGMFTKRLPSHISGGGKDAMRFFTACAEVVHMSGQTRFTVSTPGDLENWNLGVLQARTNAYGDSYPNRHAAVLGEAVLWPSLDNHGPCGELTEITAWTGVHRLLCLRGFTPMAATVVTAYTLPFKIKLGTTGDVRFYYTGTPSAIGAPSFLGVAGTYAAAVPGVTNTFLGYLNPAVGISQDGIQLNLKV